MDVSLEQLKKIFILFLFLDQKEGIQKMLIMYSPLIFFDLNKFALSLSLQPKKKVKPFYTIWMRQDGSCALFILCLCVDIDKGHLHAYPAYGGWRFLHKRNQALLVEGPCYSQVFFMRAELTISCEEMYHLIIPSLSGYESIYYFLQP